MTDAQVSSYTVYIKTGCPYSRKVLDALDALAIPYEEKNIKEEAFLEELIERGGKKQVPFLFDHQRRVGKYESADIVAHLEENHGALSDAHKKKIEEECPE